MKKNKTPSVVTVSILTIITISFWVVFSILRLIISPPEPQVEEDISSPLDPKLNEKTLGEIGGKTFYDASQIETQIAIPTESPEATATPTATAVASPSATPAEIASPSATPGL
ncbi:hypothetical protein M1545_03730 [Patescibacteria group bacterium]|nr:hypothetical protein [Patescibacteria group bacterium]